MQPTAKLIAGGARWTNEGGSVIAEAAARVT
jgi:hypothetical protein